MMADAIIGSNNVDEKMFNLKDQSEGCDLIIIVQSHFKMHNFVCHLSLNLDL